MDSVTIGNSASALTESASRSDPTQSTTVFALVAVLVLFLVILVASLAWLTLSVDNSRMNRRIKDFDGPQPDEIRNARVIASQFVTMNVVNLIAAALAGIGGSLFVDGGRLRLPSTQAPLLSLSFAVILTEFTGMAVAFYVSRPLRAWITDSSIFRSHLRALRARGIVGENELAEIRKDLREWLGKTKARPLHDPDELCRLGLALPKAPGEWIARRDPVEFGILLRADVRMEQVLRWITRKRLWRLGIPPLMLGVALAIITGGLAGFDDLVPSLSVSLYAILAIGFSSPLYVLTYQFGRLDLVMTNRYLALERKQLRDCDQLISQLQELHDREHVTATQAGAGPSAYRVLLRIGQWDLCRRYDRMPARLWHSRQPMHSEQKDL